MSPQRTAHDGPAVTAEATAGRRAASWLLGIAIAVALLSGCSSEATEEIKRLALPERASDRGTDVAQLWGGAWLAAAIVGVFVWGLILWVVVRYRRRDEDEVPTQNRYNLPIEVLYTVAPLIVIGVLFFFTVETQNDELAGSYGLSPDIAGVIPASAQTEDGHHIEVVGQKWAWTFNYLDEPSLGGSTDVFDIGTPEQLTELYLAVDEPVTFTLISPDVIHSFWIPEFYFKLDVIPGKENTFTMTPTREGTYRGRCAELCGIYHSRMLFDVNIVSLEEYEAHLADLEAAGQVGAPSGGSYAYTIVGSDEDGGAQ